MFLNYHSSVLEKDYAPGNIHGKLIIHLDSSSFWNSVGGILYTANVAEYIKKTSSDLQGFSFKVCGLRGKILQFVSVDFGKAGDKIWYEQ